MKRKRQFVKYYLLPILLLSWIAFYIHSISPVVLQNALSNGMNFGSDFSTLTTSESNVFIPKNPAANFSGGDFISSSKAIQYKVDLDVVDLCKEIQRPRPRHMKKFKDTYHYFTYKNDSLRTYILNTYVDNRVPSYDNIVIRTVLTSNFDPVRTGIYAGFWYPGFSYSVPVKCVVTIGPGPHGKNALHYGFNRYAMVCTIPRDWFPIPPEKVSLSVSKCAPPENYIDVVVPPPNDKDNPYRIGNCMQSLYGNFSQEFAFMFIHWMELITLFGVSEVTVNLNSFQNNPFGEKVFKYYEDKGVLKVTTYPDIVPEGTTLREQTVGRIQSFIQLPFQECFFRNMHRYWYFLPFDVDEIFVLREPFKTYQDYLKHVISRNPAAVHSIFFTTHVAGFYLNYGPANLSVPEYLPYFRYTKRDVLRNEYHKKSFQNPRTCVMIDYHACRPLSQSDLACETCGYQPIVLPPEDIILNHYRHSCKNGVGCLTNENAIVDDALLHKSYTNYVTEQVKETLKHLGYFK